MENLYNSKLNMYHLIIRPNLYDQDKFKAFTPFVVNWIFKKSNISFFSISEELGKNGGYHLDITIFATTNIEKNILNNKGENQLGLRGHAYNFANKNLPNTKNSKLYFTKVKEDDHNTKEYNVRKVIGYSFKEQHDENLKNWNNLEEAGITKEDIGECITFYYEHTKKKYELEDKEDEGNDVIPLNPKCAMFNLKQYIREHRLEDDKEIYFKLKSATSKIGYCWAGMSAKATRTVILQLKNFYGHIDDQEEDELNDDCFKKFENMELEQLKMIRHHNCPREERLKMLYEYQFISKKEYELLK